MMAMSVIAISRAAERKAGKDSESPLGRRDTAGNAFVVLRGHAQRAAKGLEDRFALMVRVFPTQVINMQRYASMVDEPLEKFARQIDIKIADARTRIVDKIIQSRTTRKIDHHTRQRLVERNVGMAVTANAFFVSDRFRKGLTQGDADIFDGMVIVDMRIAIRAHVKIDHAVAYDLIQHMIEKRHPGGEVAFTAAIEVKFDGNASFKGIASNFCLTHDFPVLNIVIEPQSG